MNDVQGPAPNNLPLEVTSFIGRNREIAETKRLLASTRLLTLSGVGGCGKSRLALRVASDVLSEYPNGVWLVEFAPLTDPILVPHTVAAALTVRERLGRPITDTVVEHLRSKALLLVLDNCEHVRAACTTLADALLRACPNLRVPATSREVLGLAGEAVYRVPPLSVPDPGRVPLEQLSQYEAVRLFVERARSSQPGFRVTANNAPALVQVCRRLDGMPLAIELAAARVKVLAVEQIAARLDDRFRLLTGGSQATLPRHQALRAAMDWSYALLSDKERCVLRTLSVFAGGWTLEAAEAVSAGDDVEASEVLDVLAQLVDKSLVGAETEGGEARYRLLETVRQYALDRLIESGEAPIIRRRHRDWYLGVAEQAWPKLRRPEQDKWLHRLEREHDNLRAALEWSKRDDVDAEAGLRLAGALWWFWAIHGDWTEGRGWLEGVLSRGYEPPPSALQRALRGACFFASRHGDYGKATAFGEQGLALGRELGDGENTALCLIHLGGVALRQGNYPLMKRLLSESLPLCQEIGDKWLIGLSLSSQASLAEGEGDFAQAETWCTQGLALFMEVGDKVMIADSLLKLGLLTLVSGEHERASKLLAESLTLGQEIGSGWVAGYCLLGLAGVACGQERYERAARLLGAADVWHGTLGMRYGLFDKAHSDRVVAATRAHLGNMAFTAAWVEGRTMAAEEAIEYALAPRRVKTAKAAERMAPGLKHLGILTAREREVAALIARGLTNREIASSLFISERTADAHVQHILNKLNFNARAQIAAWVVEHELRKTSGA